MWSLLLGLACTATDKGETASRDSARDTGPVAQDSADTDGPNPIDTGAPHTGDSTVADSDTGGHTGDTGPIDTGTETGPGANALPDFLLADLNPNSARYGELVSPRDYLEEVSGWYFIHAG